MGDIKKIAHLADIHIRNLKYHSQYKQIFETIYEKLKEEEVDFIYLAGDLAHTKTQLSPEYFHLCSLLYGTQCIDLIVLQMVLLLHL